MALTLIRRVAPILTLALAIGIAAVDPAFAQELKKAETGLENFLKFFSGNMGNIIVALAIIAEATLSFLGVGIPPTQPSLGTLIRIGNDFLRFVVGNCSSHF